MVANTICKGIFIWKQDDILAYLILATDDILFATNTTKAVHLLETAFHKYFSFTMRKGSELSFLNFRIIQRKHGISIDQSNHIKQKILDEYFPTPIKVPFQSSPFPLCPKFEMTLFASTPLDQDQHFKMAKIHHGSFNHWTGAIIHIAGMSRPDLSYSVMRLSGYNASPTIATFHALHHFMCFLFHHPHVPIMYRRGSCNDGNLKSYTVKGHAEILDPDTFQGLKVYIDADLARDLSSRRSVSSVIIELNGTAVAWGSHKQAVPGTCTNITETTAIFKGVKRTLETRRFLESMNEGDPSPTPIMEDNQATITQIKKDRLTPRVKQLDIIITWLHYHYNRGTFIPLYINTHLNKADMNTKPHGGETLQKHLFSIIGFKLYPPTNSEHYKLLELHLYNNGEHKGTFLLFKEITKPSS